MYSQRDLQAWERIQKQARYQWKSSKSGNICPEAVNGELGERIDLTIDSGCAACALLVVEILKSTLRQTLRKIRELGLKTPTLKFQNGDAQSLKFSVLDKLHKPLMAACKVVAAGNRIVLQPEKDVRSMRRKRIFERK